MEPTVVEGGATRGWLDDALDAVADGGLREPDDAKIGVVFVHGIGSQKIGETLLSWSRSILAVIGTWSARNGGPYQLVHRAHIDFEGRSMPYVEIELPEMKAHPRQTWVLTEAYWASQLRPPSIREMLSWLLVRRVGLDLARGLASGIASSLGWQVGRISGFVLGVLIVAAIGVAFVAFAVSRILSLIPIGWLRHNLVTKSFDYFLGDWFGDVRILMTDRTQAANIRSHVRRSIWALRSYGCGRIVLVGHSGGTIVSYMTLVEDRGQDQLPADRLITHGQALGLAWAVGGACRDTTDIVRETLRIGDGDLLHQGDLLLRDLSAVRPNLTWHDFRASHDPAPMGGFEHAPCTRSEPWPPGESTCVFNRASLAADHGGYWDNTEDFVVPVVRLIETASPQTPVSRFYDDAWIAAGQARRHVRVAALSNAKVAITLLAIVAVLIVGPLNPIVDDWFGRDPSNIQTIGADVYAAVRGVSDAVAGSHELLQWAALPSSIGVAEPIFGLVLVALAFVGTSSVASRIWSSWDTAIRRRFLIDPSLAPTQAHLFASLGLCVAAGVLLMFFTSTGAWVLVFTAIATLVAASAWSVVAARFLVPR